MLSLALIEYINITVFSMEKETKKCPYCGETIMATAKKCRYCGEWLIDKDEKEQAAKNEESAEILLGEQKGCLDSNEGILPVQPMESLSSSNSKKSSKGAITVLVIVLLVACGISSYYLVKPMYDFLMNTDVSYDSCEPLSYVFAIGLSVIVASLIGWLLIKMVLPHMNAINIPFPKIRIGKRTAITLCTVIVILSVIGIIVFNIQKEKEETRKDLGTYDKALVSIKFNASVIHLMADLILSDYEENWRTSIWKGYAYDDFGNRKKCKDFNEAVNWRISKYKINAYIPCIDSLYEDIEKKKVLIKGLKHKPTDAPDKERCIEELRSCSYDLKDYCNSPQGNFQSFCNAVDIKIHEADNKINSFTAVKDVADSAKTWFSTHFDY